MPKKKYPNADAIADLHGKLTKAGCDVTFHDQNQWNIRKDGRLAMWFPFSKKQSGACIEAGHYWEPGVTVEKVLEWLGGPTVDQEELLERMTSAVLPVAEDMTSDERADEQGLSDSQDDRRFEIMNKRLSLIEARLCELEA